MIKGILHEWRGSRLAAVLALCLAPLMASAAIERTNPVTGDTESYENVFSGTTAEWNSADNWDTSTTPFITTTYTPALVTNKAVSTSTAIDGWTLRVGAYDGANVTWSGGITKIQAGSAGCWLTADETSSITVAFNGNSKQLEGSDTYPFKLSSANAGGITWTSGLADAGNTSLPFWYYLKGTGTIVYNGDITIANAQVIKVADVTLTGTSQVSSKTLVTFGSGTTKTFTADATIKRLNSSGIDLDNDAHVAAVTTGSTTLTASDAVGTCELVQTSTGIDLYWVDGDPDDLAPTVYKPSININFRNNDSNGLTTSADVGLNGYAVPGASWNNFTIPNNSTERSFDTVNSTDSTGAASVESGVSVNVSAHRGSYACDSLAAASNPLQSYIDEGGSLTTPTVTVTGIPYDKYHVLVYASTDAASVGFGYFTINGTNYTYVDGNRVEGTTAWGNSGVYGSANAIEEGVNVLVSPVLQDSTLTVVGHRSGNNPRGCIAAIQIIEDKDEIGENDMEIPVSGDTTYTVSEAKDLTGTVYLTGSGTLTLGGTAKISAATIHVARSVTLNINADRLDATTFTGGGTVVYTNALPVTDKGWTDSDNWTGTVWINGKSGVTDFNVNSYGNANSAVKLSGVDGWISAPFDNTVSVILENGTFDYALKLTNGNSPNAQNPTRCTTFVKVSGSGTISDGNAANPMLKIYDGTEFTGTITLTRARVVFCSPDSTTLPAAYTSIPTASIYVDVDNSATVSSGKTWTANGGFIVDGTLTVDGTLSSSHATKAVSGSGTVVFTGRAPTVSGDAWWKNAAWTGTVQIDSITDLVGTSTWGSGTYLDFDSYGNANSVIKLGNITGWLAGDTCNVPVNLAGTLTINNGFSGSAFTFKKLISNGGYITATDQAATARIVIEDGSEYAGYIGLNAKMVVFGADNPTFVKGQVYVSSDAKITVPAVNTAYWAVGNIVVAGELKADNLARFGGGTHINTTGDGVFTLTSTGNGSENETDTDYARISGTGGSLKYEGTGWRALSTNNFPTAVTLVNEQAGDIVLSRALTYTIGSLAGSKNFQGNYGSGSRYLNVIQSKDTEWSGKVVYNSDSRFAGLKLDASSTGTLTLSGTATQSVALDVNGGAVNLTGTWIGDATVNGTFGGTGTLTGDLTFNDNATFMATNTPLTVTGNINVPASGVVTVDVSRVTFDQDTITILQSNNGIENSGSFKVIGEVPEDYTFKYQSASLVLTKSSGGDDPEPTDDQVRFWVKNVANADVNVYTNGVLLNSVGVEDGFNIYFPNGGADATIVYSAQQGYVIIGKTKYPVLQVSDGSAFPLYPEDIADMSVTNVNELTEVAFVTDSDGVNTLYETLNDAFDDVESNETVTLIRDAELTNNVALDFPVVVAGYNNCKMGGPLTLASGSSLTMREGVAITNVIAVTDYNVTVTYPTALAEVPTVTPPEGYDAVVTDNEDGTSTISFKKHEEPVPPTPSSGYGTWAEENGIEGDWDSATDGIANVFRYVFGVPADNFQLITNITFNADSHAVIWTPQMVNDTDSAEFAIYVVPSADLVFDESDENDKVSLSSDGETEINEDLQEARFFRLKAEKKPQE